MNNLLDRHDRGVGLVFGMALTIHGLLFPAGPSLAVGAVLVMLAVFPGVIRELDIAGVLRLRTRTTQARDYLQIAKEAAPSQASAIDEALGMLKVNPPRTDEEFATFVLAAVSARLLVPGRLDQPAGALTVAIGEVPPDGIDSVRLVIETAGVSFSAARTPVITSNVQLATQIVHRREIVSTAFPPVRGRGVVTYSGLAYDVLSTAVPGTDIVISATVGGPDFVSAPQAISAGVITTPDAIVESAAVPTSYVGRQDQATGLISILELQPGALGGPQEATRQIRLRLVDAADPDRESDDRFTRPPWLVVRRGDLKLGTNLHPSRGATAAQGYVPPDEPTCVLWTLLSASTVPSILQVRGTDASGALLPPGHVNGPRLNPGSHPGPSLASVQLIDANGSTVMDLGVVSMSERASPR